MFYDFIPFMLYGLAVGLFLILGLVYWLDTGSPRTKSALSSTRALYDIPVGQLIFLRMGIPVAVA
ncbi:hypothetical protein [Allopusillimonas ginsengisoli]|uniref:hypothetical protein n=1 Tax=Allopusillimonas ginsengisoli TaxID=453575 RepID=UPI001020C4CD|nr:hypothetical protein [Allopusillimonas ginsengisoli]TEA77310.1 hypothetical protein ERE07_15285 [Allopusillimonas ginsengisoli]